MTNKNKFKQKKPDQDSKFTANGGYNNLYPKFSFSEFVEESEYFSKEHSNEERNSLYNFFRNIKKFSKETWGDIKQKPHIYHYHPVEENISCLNDFDSIDLIQFKIPGQKQGRFVGFLDENNIFNILLYDSQHSIYSRN